jgi:hypothetical protein
VGGIRTTESLYGLLAKAVVDGLQIALWQHDV